MTSQLEIAGSALTFLGGSLLSVEALLIKRRIRAESGASRLREILGAVGAGGVLKDERGTPLDSEEALRLWFADRTFRWSWIGFPLMTLGFICDFVAKVGS